VEPIALGSSDKPATGNYAVAMDGEDVLASVPEAIAQTPMEIAIGYDGKKFNAGKAAKVAYKNGELIVDTSKGANISGITLKYSNGALSGSFYIYAISANGKLVKNKFTITGTMVEGSGYATATCKKLKSIPVLITPAEE